MALVTGFIEEVFERPSQYKWPNGKPKPSMWSMKVDNVRYGCKNTQPPAQGTYVKFNAEQNDAGYWDADPTTITKAEQTTDTPKLASKPSAIVSNRDTSIHYQSSRKDALVLMEMLLQHGLIDFGKAKGAQKIELVEIYLDNYTQRFVEDINRLAPPEHGSPTEASAPEEATAITKPPRKAPAATAPVEEEFDDELPFH